MDDYAFTDMREASRRLTESMFDSYEDDWVGQEDMGAIVEVSMVISGNIITRAAPLLFMYCCRSIRTAGFTSLEGGGDKSFFLFLHNYCNIYDVPSYQGEDLLWSDYEVKLLDQAVRTVESYVSQFPEVRVRQEEASEQNKYRDS